MQKKLIDDKKPSEREIVQSKIEGVIVTFEEEDIEYDIYGVDGFFLKIKTETLEDAPGKVEELRSKADKTGSKKRFCCKNG